MDSDDNWWQAEAPDLMSKIPAEWFLTQVGTTLASDINSNITQIPVNAVYGPDSIQLFKEGDTLVCGYESMKVVSVDYHTKVLTVERGFYRAARAHSAGKRIAGHISFWPETWVMNMSTLCPKVDAGNGPERWIDWAAKRYVPVVFKPLRDGILLDRLEKDQSWLAQGETSARSIDPDCSNTFVTDEYAAFDGAWYDGIRTVLPKIRENIDGKPLFANSYGAFYSLLNGSLWESCPGNWSDTVPETYSDWKERILGDDGYINVSKSGYTPNFSWIETYELEEYLPDPGVNNPALGPGFTPNYQKMRFGLTTALLGDGYFSYEINTNGHAYLGLLWFDEYDNAGAGKGYLGKPVKDAFVARDLGSEGKVYRRDFENGIVICNPTSQEITVDLGDTFTLIKGTQVPEINTGEKVSSISITGLDGRILLK